KVGSAELDYALIAAGVGPGDALICPPTPGGAPPPTPTTSPAADAAEQVSRRKGDIQADCETFLDRHKLTDRGASVMWIMATLKDVNVDPQALARGLVLCEYFGPSAQSVGLWEKLADRYPSAPEALVAQFRLGVVALRQERIRKGREHLHVARSLLMTFLEDAAGEEAPGLWERIFIPMESLPGKEYYRSALDDVAEVIWLMEVNRVAAGSRRDVTAFAEYMKLWPAFRVPRARLKELADGAAETQLADDFRVRWALAEEDPLRRAEALAALAEEVNDAAIVANYELGRLAFGMAGQRAWRGRKLKGAEEYFKVVVTAPDSPYRALANRHLRWLARRKEALPPVEAARGRP
ncbi:hypothetical protein LCGC14_2826440, partial [marine sediment metagenome]